MWETIGKVLTDPHSWFNLMFVAVVIVIVFLILMHLSKRGYIRISTKSVQLGDDVKERDIIRQQVEWAHIFIAGLRIYIPETPENHGYFTKYILEVVYSEVVDWITFNHIKVDSDYVAIKQAKIKSLVYSFDISPEYKTQKFEKQIDAWVDELIRKLVLIREVYK